MPGKESLVDMMVKGIWFGMVAVLLIGFASVSADVYYSCETGPFVKHSDHGYYTVFGYDSPERLDSIFSEDIHFYHSKTWWAYNMARCASGDMAIGDEVYGAGTLCTEEIFDMRCADDLDFDGYNVYDDCDDDNPFVNPGMSEICGNGVDDNCDGVVDEGCVIVCENDLDCGEPVAFGLNSCYGDDVYDNYDVPFCENAGGYDSYCSSYEDVWFVKSCDYGCLFGFCLNEPVDDDLDDDGYTVVGGDCDDGDYYVNPGMEEDCLTAYDDNCDGNVNEGCGVVCDENVVNGSWNEWEDVSGCVDNWVEQSRSRVEYDAEGCGDFEDVTHVESRDVVCGIECDEDIVFDNWSEWSNQSECSNGTLEQARSRVEYDASFCGFDNVTHVETRDVDCFVAECSVDLDCGSNDDERYCDGDDVYERTWDFSCVEGSCVEDVSEEFVRGCSDDCDDGRCVSNSGDADYDEDFSYINFISEIDGVSSSAVIDLGSEVEDESFLWVWILLLVIGILILLGFIYWVIRN